MKQITLTCSLIALITSLGVTADIRIHSTDNRGRQVIFSSNDQFARMDNQREKNYALMDFKRQHFMLVNPQQHEVLLLDNSPTAARRNATLDITIKPLGDGPAIAGFATRKYLLSANGTRCAVIYGSKQASRQPGMQKLFGALEQLQQRISNMMSGFNPLMDICSRAKSQTAQTFKTTGLPMRIDSANGQTQSRITRIETSVKIAANAYQIPPGYKVTRMKDQMKQIEQQKEQAMQEIQRQMPDMQKMIEQLQQDGKMPEEAMEQLRKMKELFKQRVPK